MRLRATRSARPRTRRTHSHSRSGACSQTESAGSSTRRSTSSGRLCPTSSAPQSERHSCRCCIRVARVHAHASAHHPPKLARSPQRAGRHMLQQIATTAPSGSALSGAAARTGDNFVMGRGCSACRWDRQLKVKVRLAYMCASKSDWASIEVYGRLLCGLLGTGRRRPAQGRLRPSHGTLAGSATLRARVSGRPSRASESAGLPVVPPACRAVPSGHDPGRPRTALAAAAPRWGQEEPQPEIPLSLPVPALGQFRVNLHRGNAGGLTGSSL